MHQSPQKKLANRREKYSEFDPTDTDADRRPYRPSQPKARKFALRDEPWRESRSERNHSEN
ncbi:hypothetical protein [Caenimonas soli]|jgi:hypothetical protein|uniref:hypothetical protein n=1 Tax=Caenimonas soli TaxID=2735555 RepID=UPI0015543078|nr:hypothetical protein [Caenimonas soli]NPC55553.1 hypothetical protein [Caenimonas soli]